MPVDSGRLLFVISGDYGELSNALYLLAGQPFVGQSTIALPQSLYAANAATLPCTAVQYNNVDDLIQLVENERPAVAFLLSGYLFSFSSPVTVEDLDRLVGTLRRHGARIVTSDPFLGAMGRAETAAYLARLHEPFPRSYDVLKDVVHFYPAPCSRLACSVTAISTFNAQPNETVNHPDITEPFWLFVLSKIEYAAQVNKYGAEVFAADVSRRLADASRLGRQPVLIAPAPLVDAVRECSEAPADAVLHAFCRHDLFTWLAVRAEQAFYWNLFSNSIVVRFGNSRPPFFFDIGHIGQVPWLYELAVENYFLGWRPVCLDHRRELTPELLNLWSSLFKQEVTRVRDHFRSSPPPSATIAALLRPIADARVATPGVHT